jgi:hypothetical protein
VSQLLPEIERQLAPFEPARIGASFSRRRTQELRLRYETLAEIHNPAEEARFHGGKFTKKFSDAKIFG